MSPKPRTAGKAIRAFCADCIGTANAVPGCTSFACPLWLYRHGKRPRSVEVERLTELTGGKTPAFVGGPTYQDAISAVKQGPNSHRIDEWVQTGLRVHAETKSAERG